MVVASTVASALVRLQSCVVSHSACDRPHHRVSLISTCLVGDWQDRAWLQTEKRSGDHGVQDRNATREEARFAVETAVAYFVQGMMGAAAVGLQELFGSISNVRSSKICAVDGHLVRTAEGCPQRQWSVVAHRRKAAVAS